MLEGGGASGGAGKGVAYGNLKGSTGSQEFKGDTAANTGNKTWTIPSAAKGNVPELDIKCKILLLILQLNGILFKMQIVKLGQVNHFL